MGLRDRRGSMALHAYCVEKLAGRPDVQVHIAGWSVLRKPIVLLRVGDGPRRVHLNGAMHGNEWLTAWAVLDIVETLLSAPWAPYRRQFTMDIVPMVNPDGVDLALAGWPSWKANARGVDLNDQFPAGWLVEQRRRGMRRAGAADYGGAMPLTEPEAQLLAQLVRSRDYASVVAVHAQGEEIYYNYREREPAYAQHWATEMARAADYTAVALTDSDAGFKDWFIQETNRPGFTLEVGLGQNPLPERDLMGIGARLRACYERYLQLHLEGTNTCNG